MKSTKFVLASLAFALSASVTAQTQVTVSTGSPTGTYSQMFKELQRTCKDQLEVPSTGSIQNMDRILGNKVNAAIIQTDVLFYRKQHEDLSNIKTLFTLHPEEVHVITPSVSPIKIGGIGGIGGKNLQLKSVGDLAGQSVAAWGGSVITAQFIRSKSEVAFSVLEVQDFKSAKQALDDGKVAAIVMVGGQPMSDVQTLDRSYKLLPFSEAAVGKLKSVYVPAKLNYSNMGQGGSGVASIATDALFVTRVYKTATIQDSLSTLRSCFKNNVYEISETLGTHKKWISVNPDNKGKWEYYDLPETGIKKK